MPLSIILALVVCAMLRQVSAFTSIYVFGDGISATTTAPSLPELHTNRYSNGRVWVEVLAQRQGLTLASNNNVSFFGHFSSGLVTNVNNLTPPADVSSSLFVVWVNNADFVDIINYRHPNPFVPTNIVIWTSGISQALSNHLVAIQALHTKGVRTLVMPNGADVAKVPSYQFMSATNKAFVRQRIIEFNNGFTTMLQQARSSLSNLTIISPNFFALTDQIIGSPASYGFTNSTLSAVEELLDYSFTGPGTNFVFWDPYHPTAKVHEILADTAHQLISPTRITSLAQVNGSNQLSVVNMPIGLSGFVEGTTNLVTWSAGQGFSSTNTTQTITVPVNGPRWFYRLRFPFAWSWP